MFIKKVKFWTSTLAQRELRCLRSTRRRFDPRIVCQRIQHCHSCSTGHNCSSDLIPGLGTAYASGSAKKERKKKKKGEILTKMRRWWGNEGAGHLGDSTRQKEAETRDPKHIYMGSGEIPGISQGTVAAGLCGWNWDGEIAEGGKQQWGRGFPECIGLYRTVQ